MLHFWFGGLIGACNATVVRGRSFDIFVAEPEAELTLNVTRVVRLGFAAGYRFVGNAGTANDDLSGWSTTFTVGLAFLRN